MGRVAPCPFREGNASRPFTFRSRCISNTRFGVIHRDPHSGHPASRSSSQGGIKGEGAKGSNESQPDKSEARRGTRRADAHMGRAYGEVKTHQQRPDPSRGESVRVESAERHDSELPPSRDGPTHPHRRANRTVLRPGPQPDHKGRLHVSRHAWRSRPLAGQATAGAAQTLTEPANWRRCSHVSSKLSNLNC